jgi:hypothetical protein
MQNPRKVLRLRMKTHPKIHNEVKGYQENTQSMAEIGTD